MKKFAISFIFFISYILILVVSCKHSNKIDCEGKDSIVIFFRPIYTSDYYDAHRLMDLASKSSPIDTIWLEHNDFIYIKQFIDHKEYIHSDTIGVPEILLKTNRDTIFLTSFEKWVTDVDRNPLATNKETIKRIYDISKIYNYFTKEEILWGEVYTKIPEDYNYYYEKKNRISQSGIIMDHVIADKKRGIKIWMIDKGDE